MCTYSDVGTEIEVFPPAARQNDNPFPDMAGDSRARAEN